MAENISETPTGRFDRKAILDSALGQRARTNYNLTDTTPIPKPALVRPRFDDTDTRKINRRDLLSAEGSRQPLKATSDSGVQNQGPADPGRRAFLGGLLRVGAAFAGAAVTGGVMRYAAEELLDLNDYSVQTSPLMSHLAVESVSLDRRTLPFDGVNVYYNGQEFERNLVRFSSSGELYAIARDANSSSLLRLSPTNGLEHLLTFNGHLDDLTVSPEGVLFLSARNTSLDAGSSQGRSRNKFAFVLDPSLENARKIDLPDNLSKFRYDDGNIYAAKRILETDSLSEIDFTEIFRFSASTGRFIDSPYRTYQAGQIMDFLVNGGEPLILFDRAYDHSNVSKRGVRRVEWGNDVLPLTGAEVLPGNFRFVDLDKNASASRMAGDWVALYSKFHSSNGNDIPPKLFFWGGFNSVLEFELPVSSVHDITLLPNGEVVYSTAGSGSRAPVPESLGIYHWNPFEGESNSKLIGRTDEPSYLNSLEVSTNSLAYVPVRKGTDLIKVIRPDLAVAGF